MTRRFSVKFEEETFEQIERIRKREGLKSQREAVLFALNLAGLKEQLPFIQGKALAREIIENGARLPIAGQITPVATTSAVDMPPYKELETVLD
jgi:hypothetical protein